MLHPRTLEPLEPVAIPVFVGKTLEPQRGRHVDRPLGTPSPHGQDGTAA